MTAAYLLIKTPSVQLVEVKADMSRAEKDL